MVKKMVHDFEVSVNPIDSIRVFRKLVQHHGWEYNRTESSRLVDRFAIIMPMAQSTRTLGVTVTSGPLKGLNLTAWSEVRGTSAKSTASLGYFLEDSMWRRILTFCKIGYTMYHAVLGSGHLEKVECWLSSS